ncbi:MAG: magnesium transporter MgtE N-terminal domain-containing protein [Clostridiaceae bacterium]
MKKLSSFYFSNIHHKNVYDEYDETIGKLWDIYVTTEEFYPKAIGYIIKRSGEFYNYEFRNIDVYIDEESGKIKVKVKGVNDIIPRKYSYLLSKNLISKQIVDINGKKLVRVNDLRIAELSAELKVIAVDTGTMALARRFGYENAIKKFFKIFGKKSKDALIIWDNVESLEMVSDNLKLSVSYKKLSKLHPADLADILEDMDVEYRNKVFESLEENLAADTLEEIEPEVQADILENLSESKKAEVLENMPLDEIADLLDELDDDEVEKLLVNLEKDDAKEIRKLLKYKDEEVGSLMNKDFISFNVSITCEETIEILRQINPDDEVSYYIYITDEDKKLLGVVSLKNIVLSNPSSKLKEIMEKNIIVINDDETIENALERIVKYNLISLPVIDNNKRLCGIVLISDIIDEALLPQWKKKIKIVG